MTMKQKFASKKTTFAVLMGLLVVLLLVPSCTTDDKVPDLSDEGTNDWIYKVMTDYYLWNEDVPDKGNLNFSQSPDKFFDSLLSEQDGVMYGEDWLPFSRIEKKEEETKSVTASDSYGFEPDVKLEELVVGNDLLPFGDTNERLLSEALSRISGLKIQPVCAESEGRILLTPSSLERKQTKGLIFESGK